MLVVIFAAYPVAVAIFRSSGMPKRFIPAHHGGHYRLGGGWLGLALGMLGKTYSAAADGWSQPAVAAPRRCHCLRWLDSLPHNGAVITMIAFCRLTHREAYFDIFMVSVVGPLLALVVVLAAAVAFGSF